MMTLYHGSYLPVPAPLAKAGRKNLDFGQGFYVTKLQKQAENWARIIATRKGRHIAPIVNVYHFNRSKAEKDGIKIKVFEFYDLEWLNYVVDCRKGKDISSEYDLVEGGVANDNVIDTVEDYEKGIITAEQALGQLCYKKVNHQICILNQCIIDKYLEYIGCISLNSEEDEL